MNEMNMRNLSVNVPRIECQSRVWVGRDLIRQLPSLLNTNQWTRIAVVSDSGAEATTSAVTKSLALDSSVTLRISGGDSSKSAQTLHRLWEFFTSLKLDRGALVLAIGGGAVSDLVGFAAATYMRGIAFVPVPTTLLAQVDASIGGKTGINFGGVKNLLGAIKQPHGIVIDIDTLRTLPQRDLRSGFAEVLKHGLIADRSYFQRVSSRDCLSWSADELVEIVFRSCEIKRDIIQADESEQGLRKILNFGHTIGHAIEALALGEADPITHGEAVAMGAYAESHISRRLGLLTQKEFSEVTEGITAAGLSIRLPRHYRNEDLLALMSRDKKNVGGETRWTLLQGIGKAVFNVSVPEDVVIEALAMIQPQ